MTSLKKQRSEQSISLVFIAAVLVLCLLPACGKKKSLPSNTAQRSSQQRKKSKKTTKKERRAQRKLAAQVSKKPMNMMNYQELREAAAYAVAQGDKQKAIMYKKRMIALCETPEDLCGLTLDIADYLYDTQDAVLAGKMYLEFTKLYPGNEHVEYAYHRAIVCSYAQTLDPDRDQTKTKETLELAEAFLTRPLFVKWRDAVKTIKTQCQKKLFDSEMGIVAFYTGRGDYKTALRRVDQIRVAFTPIMPEAEIYLLASEIDIADKQRDLQKLAEKEADYAKTIASLSSSLTPNTTRVAVADRLKERSKPFVNRF